MNMRTKALLVIAALGLALGASAQQPPQGGPPRGGFGGGPGGQGPQGGPGMRMRMGGGLIPLQQLIVRKDVQSDLQLTSDQRDRLPTVMEQLRPGPGGPGFGGRFGGGQGGPPGRGGQGGGFGGGQGGPPPPGQNGQAGPPGQGGQGGGFGGGQGGPPPPGQNGQAGPPGQGGQGGPPAFGQGGPPQGGGFGPGPGGMDMNRRAEQILQAFLTETQMKRLKEIDIQLSAGRAVLDPNVGRQLDITDGQREQIRAIMQSQGEKMRSMFDENQGDPQAMQKAMRASQKVLSEKLLGVLTGDQKHKLAAMGGKPFKATDPDRPFGPPPGGFGGPPGGGGGGGFGGPPGGGQ